MDMKKILGAVIIIVLLLSNIFLIVQNQKLKDEVNSLNIKISDIEKQKQETENKPPIGWNEYVNKKFSFKMWYPEKVTDKFSGVGEIGLTESYSNPQKGSLISIVEGDGNPPAVIIYIYIYNSNSDIKEFIKNDMRKWQPDIVNEYSDSEIILNIQQIRLGNIDLYRLRNNDNYYFKKDDLIFVFKRGYADIFEDLQQIYGTMVKSFRFVE